LNPQKDQYRRGHTDSKTRDIDKGKTFILHQVAPGSLEIIFKHK
jgi:hypothetical protein